MLRADGDFTIKIILYYVISLFIGNYRFLEVYLYEVDTSCVIISFLSPLSILPHTGRPRDKSALKIAISVLIGAGNGTRAAHVVQSYER